MIIPLHDKVKKEILIYQFTGDYSIFNEQSATTGKNLRLDLTPTYKALNNALRKTKFSLNGYEDLEIKIYKNEIIVGWFAIDNELKDYIIQVIYEFENFSENINEIYALMGSGDRVLIHI